MKTASANSLNLPGLSSDSSLEASLNHLRAKYSSVSNNSSTTTPDSSSNEKASTFAATVTMSLDNDNTGDCAIEAKENESREESGGADSPSSVTISRTVDPEWVEDRFRVDRRKLEQMLQGMLLIKQVVIMKSNRKK